MPALYHNLADAADYLADAPHFMDSFSDFGSTARPWFYSFNAHLAGGAGCPSRFVTWADWHGFRMTQKLYLCERAGVRANALAENADTLDRLREAWLRWPAGYYVVKWATTTAHGSTCNIFLGECLTLCGYERDAVHAGKYLSAQSYWMGHNRGFVSSVNKRPANIKRGMIMSYNYGGGTFHLEVLTSGAQGENILGGLFESSDLTTFTSRGGGRSSGGDGVEKKGLKERTLSTPALKIFRLNH